MTNDEVNYVSSQLCIQIEQEPVGIEENECKSNTEEICGK